MNNLMASETKNGELKVSYVMRNPSMSQDFGSEHEYEMGVVHLRFGDEEGECDGDASTKRLLLHELRRCRKE